MSQNGQTFFKNLAAFADRYVLLIHVQRLRTKKCVFKRIVLGLSRFSVMGDLSKNSEIKKTPV